MWRPSFVQGRSQSGSERLASARMFRVWVLAIAVVAFLLGRRRPAERPEFDSQPYD